MTRLHPSLALAVIVAAFFVLTPGDAAAQFSKDQLKCRTTVAKSGGKLSKSVAKAITGCHKDRNKGKRPDTDDCNDIAVADTKDKVTKDRNKFMESVGGAKDKCAGLTPSDMGYDICPAPCDSIGVLGTFSQVADCVICLTEDSQPAMAVNNLGMPTPILTDKVDNKCHGALAKNGDKLLGTIIKERTKCQNGDEKSGSTSITDCLASGAAAAGADGKIGSARTKADDSIVKACAAVTPDFSALDTCEAGTDVQALATCVLDAVEAVGESLWTSYYQAFPTTPLTWTQIQANFSTSCAGGICHTAGQASGGLTDLDLYDEGHDSLVVNDAVLCFGSTFAERVVAGDPVNSFLMDKLDEVVPDCGSRMPLALPPLSPGFREGIRLWILGGAPKN